MALEGYSLIWILPDQQTGVHVFIFFLCMWPDVAGDRWLKLDPTLLNLLVYLSWVDKLWAGFVSYKDERMSKLYRKLPKYFSQSFSIVRPRSKQHKRFIKELFSHTNLRVLNQKLRHLHIFFSTLQISRKFYYSLKIYVLKLKLMCVDVLHDRILNN